MEWWESQENAVEAVEEIHSGDNLFCKERESPFVAYKDPEVLSMHCKQVTLYISCYPSEEVTVVSPRGREYSLREKIRGEGFIIEQEDGTHVEEIETLYRV